MPKQKTLRSTCPHCGTTFSRPLDPEIHAGPGATQYSGSDELLGRDGDTWYSLVAYCCPKCEGRTIEVHRWQYSADSREAEVITVEPMGAERPVPPEVPAEIASEYQEATRIAGLSSKGASTLARRCLQATLRSAFDQMPRNLDLFEEIKWVEEQSLLAPDLVAALHAVRKLGNFGAHPAQDGIATVYELEQKDLETTFDLLTVLFDELFVKPAQRKANFRELHTKLFGEAPGG